MLPQIGIFCSKTLIFRSFGLDYIFKIRDMVLAEPLGLMHLAESRLMFLHLILEPQVPFGKFLKPAGLGLYILHGLYMSRKLCGEIQRPVTIYETLEGLFPFLAVGKQLSLYAELRKEIGSIPVGIKGFLICLIPVS